MAHINGDEINFTIPEDHRSSSDTKKAYLQSRTDSHVLSTPKVIRNKIVIIEAVIILVLIALKVFHVV